MYFLGLFFRLNYFNQFVASNHEAKKTKKNCYKNIRGFVKYFGGLMPRIEYVSFFAPQISNLLMK